MILTGFDIFQYRVPLVATVKLGDTVLYEREGLLVRLSGSTGAIGWGDVAPLPGFSRESLAEARQQIIMQREALRGWFITSDWLASEGAFVHHLDGQGLAPSVRFGLELALGNLQATARGQTLAHLLTPQPRTTVSLNGLLMGASTEIIEEARRMHEAGYRVVKIKVGRGAVEDDIDRVREVCRVLGPDIRVRLDANRAWRFDEASVFVRGLAGLALDYIEEPLNDPTRLRDLVEQYGAPVALDETLTEVSVEALGLHQYARAVILKPTLLGGLVPTLRMARRATMLGMASVLSASFETGIGLQGLIMLAAAVNPTDVAAGLDTYRWLADDVLTPRLDLAQGVVDVAALLDTRHTINTSVLQEV